MSVLVEGLRSLALGAGAIISLVLMLGTVGLVFNILVGAEPMHPAGHVATGVLVTAFTLIAGAMLIGLGSAIYEEIESEQPQQEKSK